MIAKFKLPYQILLLASLCLLLCACQANIGSPKMLDREIASELFGHQLVPCTKENFQGYSLDWVSSGQDGEIIYTHVNYNFSNGAIQVWDYDREGGNIGWFLMDTDSVIYNEKTFYIKDASLEGYTSVQYFPNGGSGLNYSACFPTEMDLSEIFDLLLSLQILD